LNEQAQSKEGGEYTDDADLRMVHGTPSARLGLLGTCERQPKGGEGRGRGERKCASGGGHVPYRAK
jgi:hypothetical protein